MADIAADNDFKLYRSTPFVGPKLENYLVTDEFGIGPDIVWSACGEEDMLNIRTQVGILPIDSKSDALMTVSEYCLLTSTLPLTVPGRFYRSQVYAVLPSPVAPVQEMNHFQRSHGAHSSEMDTLKPLDVLRAKIDDSSRSFV